ncbi:MAG: hypothetical protein JW804_08650 [Sedimentisphaerales bacterium]|nr:hypothetical protein [Sedimentisphaerales bacterium]
MATTLNGQSLFDEQDLKIETGSIARDTIERSIGGLDGVIGIDLGQRGREIKQTGSLRARSKAELDERVGSICDYMDGYPYTLIMADGRRFDNVRIDAFKTINERPSGAGLVIDYEIIYTQLLCD